MFDATPLIYLAKVGRLELVEQLDPQCVVPERVHEEVVGTGLAQGYPDARRVERTVDSGVLETVSVAASPTFSRLQDNESLSDADAAVLAHADAHDGVAVVDETYGRDVAAAEGITTRGTAYLLLKLASDGRLSPDDTRETIDAMIDEGWYCAPDSYARIVQKLESLEG